MHTHCEGACGFGGIASPILNVGSSWKCVESFILRPLYLRDMNTSYQLDKKQGSSEVWSGGFREEINVMLLSEIEPAGMLRSLCVDYPIWVQ